jgi:outer membrane protein assembly factor BamB
MTTRTTRATRAAGVVALAMLTAAGCWPQPGAGPANDFHNPSEDVLTSGTVASLAPVWQTSVRVTAVSGAQAIGDAQTLNAAEVVSLDVATGREQWRQDLAEPGLDNARLSAGPLFVGDEVWAGWSGDVFFPEQRCPGALERLDAATGAVGAPVTTAWRPLQIVAFADKVALHADEVVPGCGSARRVVTVVDAASGGQLWEQGHGLRPVVFGDQLVQAGVNLVTESYPAGGCGAAVCEPTWTLNANLVQLAMSAEGIFARGLDVATLVDRLAALDPQAGTIVWQAQLTRANYSFGPALAGGDVYVVSAPDLLVYDQSGCGAPTCSPVWRGRTSGRASANPIVAGGVVYTGTETGAVQAWDAGGCGALRCSPLATRNVGERVTNLIVAGGRLYVGTPSGTKVFAPAGT